MSYSRSTDGSVALRRPVYWPFNSFSQYLIGNWYINTPSGERSGWDLDALLSVLQHTHFDPRELQGFSHHKLQQYLDGIDKSDTPEVLPGSLNSSDAWMRNVMVSIQVPEAQPWWTSSEGCQFMIPGLYHCSICAIIKKVYSTAKDIHFTPFEWYHQPSEASLLHERVWGDLFTSDAWLQEHRNLPRQDECCNLERAIAPLMFWSDSMHLTSFGTAKLWPIYLFFGSQTKYSRAKPSAHLCHHLAYVPSVCTSCMMA